MTLRTWRRYVLKQFAMTASVDLAMFVIVMWLLPVPAALCAPVILGTGYVTDRVMKRRLDRKRPEACAMTRYLSYKQAAAYLALPEGTL